MVKFYKKHEVLFSIFLIILYVIPTANFRGNFGDFSWITMVWLLILALVIIFFIMKNKLIEYYGMNSWPDNKKFIYFIPLILLVSCNLWSGININNPVSELIYYTISMLCVGFLEEIIFRGFLFKAIEKESVSKAVLISSITFGVGHIINLLIGADFVETCIQIICSICIGYLFVTIFQKGKSIWPCVMTHGLINSFSIYNLENSLSDYVIPLVFIIVSILYSSYLRKIIV